MPGIARISFFGFSGAADNRVFEGGRGPKPYGSSVMAFFQDGRRSPFWPDLAGFSPKFRPMTEGPPFYDSRVAHGAKGFEAIEGVSY
jgi:hypothetical protein